MQAVAQAQTPDLDAARRVVATLQLAAQEYRLAWQNGAMVAPDEWAEAKLFVTEARHSSDLLAPSVRAQFTTRLTQLLQRLEAKMPPESLSAEAGDIERRLTALLGVSLDERPSREPSVVNGETLYRSTCARCHGLQGKGDGPVALTLHITPPPANFADSATIAATTPLDLYRKVSLGVPGTRMRPYGEALSREERWDVVSYILTFSDPAARHGRSGQVAVVFGTIRGALGAALDFAAHGEGDAAERRVVDAYLAYETIEASLQATDPNVVKRAEARFASLRERFSARAPKPELDRAYADLALSLYESEQALTRSHSSTGLFVESFLLILREGFEAILVVGAIMAVLIKAGAKERQRQVRWGVVHSIAASQVTAALLEVLVRATPAQREALEGGIMLVAAATLFYVSYWLISKIEIAAWTRFVKGQILRAAESGSALALGSVAFLAVYREGFETVLFYKALYVTGAGGGAAPITAGLVAGLVALAIVYVGIEMFGLKIPMRPFFAATGVTLAFLSFSFAGDGVKELQEGGYIGSTIIRGGPRSEFLGIYPTLESLAVQGVILAAILGAVVYTFIIRPRQAPPGSPGAPGAGPFRRTRSRRSVRV